MMYPFHYIHFKIVGEVTSWPAALAAVDEQKTYSKPSEGSIIGRRRFGLLASAHLDARRAKQSCMLPAECIWKSRTRARAGAAVVGLQKNANTLELNTTFINLLSHSS